MRTLFMFIVLSMAAVACGDDPLAGLGDSSSRWVDSDPSSRAVEADASPERIEFISSGVIQWWNDDLSPETGPTASLAEISSRRNPGDRFAQASRFEIAEFFPDIEFPGQLPSDVRAVTSQLVLSPSSDSFDSVQVASFGMWTTDPYTKSRSVGQLATITVFTGDREDPCGGEGDTCETEQVGDRTIGVVPRSSGETVLWSDDGLSYEMFVRTPAMSAVPGMISSIGLISALAPAETRAIDDSEEFDTDASVDEPTESDAAR